VIDVDTGRTVAERDLPWLPTGIAVSPDGTRALVSGQTGVELIETATGQPVAAREFPMNRRNWDDPPDPAAYSPDGTRIALQRHESVEVLDATTLESRTSWSTGPYDRPMALAWLDDLTIAHAGVLGRLAVRDADTGELVGAPRQLSPGYVTSLALSPDGSLLAGLGADGEVHLLDAATRTPIGSPLQPTRLLWGWVRFTTDGSAVEVWYDDASRASYPIDSASLIARACAIASREPTAAEWAAMHGSDVQQRATCGTEADRTLLAAPEAPPPGAG
jgi:WD40 repeat protein